MIYGHKFLPEEYQSLEESFLGKITMGARINKSGMNLTNIIKAHKYQDLLDFINKCNKLDELQYLKKDISTSMYTYKTIRERVDLCIKLGNCERTKSFYNNIDKLYLSEGIKTKDVDETIKWFKEVCTPALNSRIKELKK